MGHAGAFGDVYEGQLPYCFVSYAHNDSERIQKVLKRLTREGCRIWYDEGIPPGDEWPETIANHLAGAYVCLAFLSLDALKSRYVFREIRFAEHFDKQIIFILLDDIDTGVLTQFAGRKPDCVISDRSGRSCRDFQKDLIRHLPHDVFENAETAARLERSVSRFLPVFITAGVIAVLAAVFFYRSISERMTSIQKDTLPESYVENSAESAVESPVESAVESPVESPSNVESIAESHAAGDEGSQSLSDMTDSSRNVAAGKYSDILQALYDTVSNYEEKGFLQYNLKYEKTLSQIYERGDDVRLLLQDLNGDKCEELLIGVQTEGIFYPRGVFSLQDGEELIFNPFEGGLAKDGSVLKSDSYYTVDKSVDNEATIHYVYRIKNGALKLTDTFCEWSGDYYRGLSLNSSVFLNGKAGHEKNLIEKNEYDSLSQTYGFLTNLTVYPLSEQNLESISEGNYTELEGGSLSALAVPDPQQWIV